MRPLLSFIQIIYCLYAFVLFIVVMLILFPFIVLASMLGKVKGGNIIYKLCTIWAQTCMMLWGIRHRNIYETPDDPNRASILVFNHGSYMDIPILMCAFKKHLIRVLGKIEMSNIPIFGFIYRNAVVTVDRTDASHRAKSVATLKQVLAKNISIVIAPEGTFNMSDQPLKSFYDGAFRIAIETQTPIRPVLFLDAYDRLHYRSIFSLTPGKSRAVFLPEVKVDSYTSEDVAQLKQNVYN
ncbi:MAG: 1-acyl-sn-glycerol-3-phosphate acyltransferase, partial [Chitinophagaceae bacterium]